ncbi:MAG: hypothetical protein RMJ51_05895 [Candidatus Calescibacterium sp.]|nr:hypothetical protein [Candidatus Calescibacterium sp.]MCX7972615.1 hypothetical protein [bacterium]MDW8195750.1 hypothetical protein [Candidatus Calescibacterium sp.]
MSKLLDSTFFPILFLFFFFFLILILAKNESITNVEYTIENRMVMTLYNVRIKTWKDHDQINFEAEVGKLQNLFYTNYIYSTDVKLYKKDSDRIVVISVPALEIYTNLSQAKAKNIKTIVYLKEKNTWNYKQPIKIYSKDLSIVQRNIILRRNYIYHTIEKNLIKIYYPKIEIKL